MNSRNYKEIGYTSCRKYTYLASSVACRRMLKRINLIFVSLFCTLWFYIIIQNILYEIVFVFNIAVFLLGDKTRSHYKRCRRLYPSYYYYTNFYTNYYAKYTFVYILVKKTLAVRLSGPDGKNRTGYGPIRLLDSLHNRTAKK